MNSLSRTLCRFLVGIIASICSCVDARAENIVLVGYWPPTNEMLRPFSTSPVQNPGGWMGQNWNGLGHDVSCFLPLSFHPTAIRSTIRLAPLGFIGSPESDFRVDYQDTSVDFWAVMDYVASARNHHVQLGR